MAWDTGPDPRLDPVSGGQDTFVGEDYMGGFSDAARRQAGLGREGYERAMTGEDSVAQHQMQAGVSQAQQSMAAQSVARGSNPLAMRSAMYSGGQMAGQAVNQSAQLRAAETVAARGQYMGAMSEQMQGELSLEEMRQQQQIAQAQLQQQQTQMGLDEEERERQFAMGIADKAVGLVGGLAMSDIRAKTGIAPAGGAAQDRAIAHEGGHGSSTMRNPHTGQNITLRDPLFGAPNAGGRLAPMGVYTGSQGPHQAGHLSAYRPGDPTMMRPRGTPLAPRQYVPPPQRAAQAPGAATAQYAQMGQQLGGGGQVPSDRETKQKLARAEGENEALRAMAHAFVGPRQEPEMSEGVMMMPEHVVRPPGPGDRSRHSPQSPAPMRPAPPVEQRWGQPERLQAQAQPLLGRVGAMSGQEASAMADYRAGQQPALAGLSGGASAGFGSGSAQVGNPGLGQPRELGAALAGSITGRGDVDEAIGSMDGYTYEYKPEAREQYDLPGGERYGVMAQDVQGGSELGRGMVTETPQGDLAIDRDAALTGNMAMIGRLGERQDDLDKRVEELLRQLKGGG